MRVLVCTWGGAVTSTLAGLFAVLVLAACGSVGSKGAGTDFRFSGDGTGELATPTGDIPAASDGETPAELPAAEETVAPELPAVFDIAEDTADPAPEIVEIEPEVIPEVTEDINQPLLGGCAECHNPVDTVYSNLFGRDLAKIDWTGGDLHGGSPQNYSDFDKGTLKPPYEDSPGTDYVLQCLECHVEHGADNSGNPLLLRSEVNGVALTAPVKVGDNSNGAWTQFCAACHTVTVTGPGYPCAAGTHGPGPAWTTRPCFDCHLHMKFICGPGNWSF